MTMRSPQPGAARWYGPFERFFRGEAAGGIVLLVCTAVALAWGNSPWSSTYAAILHHPLPLGGSRFMLELSVHEWINEGLMAVFFFLVGLEIKREMLIGELASVRQAALPIAGAIGGMVVPALIFASLNAGGPGARGWGIPMATDIAFALGVVALLGSRVPLSLRVFLAAVAIVDDIGAVLVIAIFYTASISRAGLVAAGVLLAILIALNLSRVRNPVPYILLGVLLWVSVLFSGIHATIAGVMLAMTIPARARRPDETPLLERLEHALHAPVAFVIVPLFALANAGVRIGGASSGSHSMAIMSGVVLGLVVGKPIGITLASWLAIRLRIAALPSGISWRLLQAVSWLGGIGFTMSLFVGALAFSDAALLDSAKIGVLIASCVAAIVGWLLLRSGGTSGPIAE
jgi:NhaA family Na+:H+ antiporter